MEKHVPSTFAEVVSMWPTAVDLAQDLGILEGTARAWRARNAIPPAYWQEIALAAEKRGFTDVTVELLAGIAARDAGRPAPEVTAA